MEETEARAAKGESRLHLAAPAEEQAWNERHLSGPVRAPSIAAWRYRVPAVVLGSSQRPDAAMSAAARAAGVALVERRSGGGAVPAGPWLLGVSVVLPRDHPLVVPSITESYRWFGEAHAAALRRAGIECQAVHDASALAVARWWRSAPAGTSARWACFGALSRWEVMTAGGRKLVGLAQVRRRTGALLVSGTLLAAPDWRVFCRVVDGSARAAAHLGECTSSCEAELGRAVHPDLMARLIVDALQHALEDTPHSIATGAGASSECRADAAGVTCTRWSSGRRNSVEQNRMNSTAKSSAKDRT
jgi:lipoate-protein ligase A